MIFPNPWNFCKAIGRAVCAFFSRKPVLCPSWEVSYRRWKCDDCRHNIDDQCELCTCFIEGKIALATEECPEGHWPAIRMNRRKKKWTRYRQTCLI